MRELCEHVAHLTSSGPQLCVPEEVDVGRAGGVRWGYGGDESLGDQLNPSDSQGVWDPIHSFLTHLLLWGKPPDISIPMGTERCVSSSVLPVLAQHSLQTPTLC